MRVLSVNVGLPREIVSGGRAVTTGIFKFPVAGRVAARQHNLEGDAQADLSVHGGPDKAVYAYPSEHYADWKQELPGTELPWGTFGENLTLEGLLEDDVLIGDRFRIGTAVLRVTQPRTPCYKLEMKFGREDIVDRFLASGRTGFYLAVEEEGELGTNDPVERIARGPYQVSIAAIHRLCYSPQLPDAAFVREILRAEVLPPGWRKRLLKILGES